MAHHRPYRGRFAPTPSGPLHLGGARTALVAWLDARAAGGRFVLRIEDLDRPRTLAGAEARIQDELHWLGLDWDEGPDLGGSYAPYRQSEKLARFGEVIAQLLAEGKAYACFCSRREIALSATAPHGPDDDGPRYPGTCRKLTRSQIADRARRRPPSIRLLVEPGTVDWEDRLHGAREDDVASTVGDFVLRRADGVPSYQLAVTVDDGEMRISDAVRGEDLISSTARQLLLHDALGFHRPRYAHVPLVLGLDGVRLAKRHGAISIGALRASGRSAEQLIGAMAASLGVCPPDTSLRPDELVRGWRLDRVARAATLLDPLSL